MEIRRVLEREEPEFLRVLCTVFDLDHSRARGIFFKEPLHDARQNWAVFQDGIISSILTLTPLHFGWGLSYGISGVATLPDARRTGLAGELLSRAMESARAEGALGFMLFAHQLELYANHGFRPVDRVWRAPLVAGETLDPIVPVSNEEVVALYSAWADEHPARLRREEARWEFWRWSLRTTEAFGGGYICNESGMFREAILREPCSFLPVPAESTWYGLASLTDNLRIPVLDPVPEMYVMALDLPDQPQMFMTDQF
ncbi:MAG: GNAT family N-acetyltransferase [Chthonomonas sp.]|nr:GNAT family N-acetyltransferase [Chthonomonas sp.]